MRREPGIVLAPGFRPMKSRTVDTLAFTFKLTIVKSQYKISFLQIENLCYLVPQLAGPVATGAAGICNP